MYVYIFIYKLERRKRFAPFSLENWIQEETKATLFLIIFEFFLWWDMAKGTIGIDLRELHVPVWA